MLKQTQSQKQLQKLIPQIIQKQNLLAIPTIALEQMVKQELELNPFLEESDELVEEQNLEDESPVASDAEKEEAGDEVLEKTSKEDEEFDTDDYLESDYEGYKASEDTSGKEKINYENMWSSKVTMKDNLLSQLHLTDLAEKEMVIGEEIIWSIDDEGYFRDNPEEIAADLIKQKTDEGFESVSFTAEEVLNVLKVIQTFEPVGIASRNLSECLISQLQDLELDEGLKKKCIDILTNHFEEFRLKNYEKLMKEYNISIETVNRIFEIISKLNPKPGYILDSSDNIYIYPDILVYKENEEYKVELNDRSVPSLKLNEMYSDLMKTSDKKTKDFIKTNFERAKWFLDSLRSRKETLMKVMYAILFRQKEFFDLKGKNLRPMLEKEVAEDISMDISTVSRTVRGKYVQSDFGIFELKHFFSYHLKTDQGDDISTKEVKNKIADMIAGEAANSPLTDDELTAELNKAGFKIARRTVAKYRESLKIPVARLRRKL
ncbi:MAG: RNA polymerase factor sigma-54 [Bacteroidetes bacterium]|nr:RNA polymerase factor sigma-54 [Bacteroidota bacterium]